MGFAVEKSGGWVAMMLVVVECHAKVVPPCEVAFLSPLFFYPAG